MSEIARGPSALQAVGHRETVKDRNISPAGTTANLKSDHDNSPGDEREANACDLFVFEANGRAFAVPADEVSETAERKLPARLPHAPESVLGVICVRGRMLTVLDPLALVKEGYHWPDTLPLIVALRGDEQLALAADRIGDIFRVSSDQFPPSGKESGANSESSDSAILGSINHGERAVLVLDSRKLFAVATGKVERRRRRI
jgi:purine-binding chemotaxis protein CheW